LTEHNLETGEIIERPAPNLGEYTVSEISSALKRTLEDRFGHVRVRGEISGFRGAHASGHCYFSLKDQQARLDAVIWRTTLMRLKTKPQEGLEVIATGKITSYPGKSAYQIVIEHIEPAGVGALMALLEERRRKLAAEGLFDQARKKPLPFLPRIVGVITSPTGAVIRDILHRLNDRFPCHVVVWPVRVQGETSAAEVAAAIRGFNSFAPRPDVLIVARGGGSLEDLWGFNDEAVVRAAAASAIPLISAVGHETDTTLIDHASDWRAPTPTAAAERAVPVRSECLAGLSTLSARHLRAMTRAMEERRTRVRAASRALPRPDEILATARQRFDTAARRLENGLKTNTEIRRHKLINCSARLNRDQLRRLVADHARSVLRLEKQMQRCWSRGLDMRRNRLASSAKLLSSLSYRSVLQRGFALVRDSARTPIHAKAETHAGQDLIVEFHDGEVPVRATGADASPAKPTKSSSGGQGTLF
jgi:exodeoxyribonuclease VII large subunit